MLSTELGPKDVLAIHLSSQRHVRQCLNMLRGLPIFVPRTKSLQHGHSTATIEVTREDYDQLLQTYCREDGLLLPIEGREELV